MLCEAFSFSPQKLKRRPDYSAQQTIAVVCKNSMSLKLLEGREHYPLHDNLQQCIQSSAHFPFSSSPLLAG